MNHLLASLLLVAGSIALVAHRGAAAAGQTSTEWRDDAPGVADCSPVCGRHLPVVVLLSAAGGTPAPGVAEPVAAVATFECRGLAWRQPGVDGIPSRAGLSGRACRLSEATTLNRLIHRC